VSERWLRFWFTPIPPHSYALLRILIGTVGAFSLLGVRDISAYWALDGMVPDSGPGMWLKTLVTRYGLEAFAPTALFVATFTAFVSMAAGIATLFSVIAALTLSLVQVSWNFHPLSGAQNVMMGVLFCMIWADCGAVWSFDAWWARRRVRGSVQEPLSYPIAPLRLIRYQIALVYLSTGLWKLYNPAWRDGSALHYVLNINVFHRFPPEYLPPWEWPLILGTYITLLWELGFAFGILFKSTRVFTLGAGVLIHLGMIAGLEIGPFSFLMLSCYVAFLNPDWVARIPDLVRARRRRPAPLSASRPTDISAEKSVG
jgi:hypothetical protein